MHEFTLLWAGFVVVNKAVIRGPRMCPSDTQTMRFGKTRSVVSVVDGATGNNSACRGSY